MTLLEQRPPLPDEPEQWDDDAATAPDAGAAETGGRGPKTRPLSVGVAAALACAAAAWLGGGLIRDPLVPRLMALSGVLIGAGLMTLSFRLPRPQILQYAVLPVAAVVGAVYITPVATGGTANLPGLVAEAIRGGGLLQPPIPFDPGWRFILVVLFAVVAAAAAGMAATMDRPRLAVVVPLPLAVGGALLQPKGSELAASAVAVFLLVGALAFAYGADVETTGTGRRSFEARRLMRAAALLVALVVGMAALAQTDFLFPQTEEERVIPPQKPPKVPLEEDRELFRANGERRGPWRLGVLDIYDGEAWLLPQSDPARVVELDGGRVPGRAMPDDPAEVERVEFNLVDMRGRSLPVPAGLLSIEGPRRSIELDPRTDVPRLEQRVPRGFKYTALAIPFPSGRDLADAPQPNPQVMAEFGSMPTAPNEVVVLLAEAPANAFDKLQFIRDRLYANVVAAGGGSPIDISPERVAELLKPGAEATPFEITAAEAMLARWAGVPSRIGFGYHGGDADGSERSFRPKHGAAWLEAWFEGHGWVPLVGTPPKAKSSLSESDKRTDQAVVPSDELAITVIVPIERPTITLLFQLVRQAIVAVVPFVALALAVLLSYPAACKSVRRYRRGRWAKGRGPVGATLIAYADFRDRCYDLNLGDPRATPYEFVSTFDYDEEHDELAWLVTRLWWGDLRREPNAEDVAAAQDMVSSVTRRVLQAQPIGNRVVAWTSRASLREPWSLEMPNFWPRLRVHPVRAVRRLVRLPRWAPRRTAPATALILLALTMGACGGGAPEERAPVAYPARLAPEFPDTLLGYEMRRETGLEAKYGETKGKPLVTEGRVYSIRRGDIIEGTMQVSLFRPDIDSRTWDVQGGVLDAIGGGFAPHRVGTIVVFVRRMPEQSLYVWFPPERNAMVVFMTRKDFVESSRFVAAALVYQRGLDPSSFDFMRPELRTASGPSRPGAETGTAQ